MSSRRDAVDVLRVFLASPGDLVEERQIAREVVDEVNEVIRTLGVHIDLLGWEDTRPGAGRPQHIINRDVDASHLFVGMMWRHWGTPTGTHSSGFEEEFERAAERRRTEGVPEMWLSFKKIGDDLLKDPGPQLRRVIEFRQQQIERRELLFRDFATADEWRSLFRKWLLAYVLEQHVVSPQSSGAIASPPTGEGALPAEQATSLGPSSPERSRQLADVAAYVSGLDPNELVLSWPDHGGRLIAHLQIIASAAMATVYSDVRLGTHEANLLYAHRDVVELTAFEKFHVVRSVVADDLALIPGWYWFTPPDVEATMFFFVADRDETVATKALQLLRQARIAPVGSYARRVIAARLGAGAVAVRDAIQDYLADVADLATVDALLSAGVDRQLLADASLAARLRAGDQAVLPELEAYAALPDHLQASVRDFFSVTSADAQLSLLTSKHEFVRYTAAESLWAVRALPDSAAFALIRDASPRIRKVSFAALLAADAAVDLSEMRDAIKDLSYDEKRALVVDYYRRLTLESLLPKARFFEFDGTEAYEAAGLQYTGVRLLIVRRDLADDFATFYDESRRSLRDTHSEDDAEAIEKLWTSREDLLKFIRREYIVAGLRILVANGDATDVVYGRKYSGDNDYYIRAAAADLLSRFGEASDASALVNIALSSHGETAARAATAAADLSDDSETVLLPLLTSGAAVLILPALRTLASAPEKEAIALLTNLLRHDKPLTRVHSAAAIVALNREDAIRVLDKYQEGYRYYDVVCCFDRLLFAPEPLRTAFQRLLASV